MHNSYLDRNSTEPSLIVGQNNFFDGSFDVHSLTHLGHTQGDEVVSPESFEPAPVDASKHEPFRMFLQVHRVQPAGDIVDRPIVNWHSQQIPTQVNGLPFRRWRG